MGKSVTLEWAPFSLKEGVSEAEILKASENLQTEFLCQQKGFIRRELLKGADNQWVDLVYWENREAAEQAAKNAANSPACFKYFALMDADHNNPGAGVFHYDQIKTYE